MVEMIALRWIVSTVDYPTVHNANMRLESRFHSIKLPAFSAVGRAGWSGLASAGLGTALLWLCLAVTAPFAWSADQETFIRLVRDGHGQPAALQVAIAGYRAPGGDRVDLVSAVHVADRAYFQELSRRFDEYDTVLYELVGEPGQVSAQAGSPSLVSMFQGGMTEALGLAFQLDEIDYQRPNMLHADLTAREFSESMRQRGESIIGLLFKSWALSVADPQRGTVRRPEVSLLRVLLADDRQLALKRLMAEQLADTSQLLELLSDEQGSTLITVRNRRALDVLDSRLGRPSQKIAIFYGAGHMPDLDRVMRTELGFRPTSRTWVQAWDLRGSTPMEE
ncbi:MAG: hypothetical protein LC637_01830 [Xanthomonadaceae bacterium]|nr:hypothetical protein [Xanthomonadaceae bacterium]